VPGLPGGDRMSTTLHALGAAGLPIPRGIAGQ
jgi:hypothetical protein